MKPIKRTKFADDFTEFPKNLFISTDRKLRHRRIITDDLNCFLADLLNHSYIEIFEILEPVTNCFDVFYFVYMVAKNEQSR